MYQLPIGVRNILDTFTKAEYQVYIVGGAVRDLLMQRTVHDWDFTTDATPEQILKLYPDGFYDNKFGTVGVEIEGEVFEITTMRKEGVYEDSRHPIEVSWTNKIEEDLARRDFTINAVALCCHPVPDTGSINIDSRLRGNDMVIVDPFNGQEDIQQKIIRCVGDSNKRFQEDALRLMRAIRIATQLDFQIESQTLEALKVNSQLIKNIAGERIRDELFKILSAKNPLEGVELLKKTGILSIILPELDKCFGLIQEGPKHDRVYDIGEHSFLALKFCPSTDPLVRFATLLHDVGKPSTVDTQDDGNVTFYNHDFVGGKIVTKIAKRFNLSKKQTDKLYNLVRYHMFTLDENQTDSAIRRFIKNIGQENIEDMLAVRIGDRLGGGTQKAVSWRMEKFKERITQVLQKPFSISDLKINGKDVMEILNIQPGPRVGKILQSLFEEILEDASKNNKDYLLGRIKLLT